MGFREAGVAAQTVWRVATRTPHEPDFRVFRGMTGRVFADIGANRGQSALSFRAVTSPGMVHSFEPNPALEPQLRRVRRVLGDRMTVTMSALGDTAGEMVLHVPVVRGRELSGEASFDPRVLDRARRRLGVDFGVVERRVPVVTFDSLSLEVDVVKVDVQGAELAVLRGMEATLMACRPWVMVEAQVDDDPERHAWMGERGFEACQVRDGRLVPAGGRRPLNWVYVPA